MKRIKSPTCHFVIGKGFIDTVGWCVGLSQQIIKPEK